MEFSGSTSTFRGGPLGTGDRETRKSDGMCLGSGGHRTLQGLAFARYCPRKGPDVASLDDLPLERNMEGSLCLEEGRTQDLVTPKAPALPHLAGRGEGFDCPKVSTTCSISSWGPISCQYPPQVESR